MHIVEVHPHERDSIAQPGCNVEHFIHVLRAGEREPFRSRGAPLVDAKQAPVPVEEIVFDLSYSTVDADHHAVNLSVETHELVVRKAVQISLGPFRKVFLRNNEVRNAGIDPFRLVHGVIHFQALVQKRGGFLLVKNFFILADTVASAVVRALEHEAGGECFPGYIPGLFINPERGNGVTRTEKGIDISFCRIFVGHGGIEGISVIQFEPLHLLGKEGGMAEIAPLAHLAAVSEIHFQEL